MPIVAEGPSYSIALDGQRGSVRIWRRPDLSTEEGARLAQEMARALAGVLPQTRSLLFDLREAPSVSGPTSVEALGTLARACERARIRIAVLVGDDAMQRLQVNRVVKEYAPEMARVFGTPEDAEPWLTS
jgi:hypothetical protein